MELSIKQSILNHCDKAHDVSAWIAAVKSECVEFDQSLVNKIILEFFLKCEV